MGIRQFRILWFGAAVLVLGGVTSAAAQDRALARTTAAPFVKEGRTGSSAWTFIVRTTNEGTRSEGLTGELYFADKPVPGELGRVRAVGYEWVYKPYSLPWETWGWRVALCGVEAAVSGEPATAEEIGRGKLRGRWEARRPGVPRTWMAFEEEGVVFWADPAVLFATTAP